MDKLQPFIFRIMLKKSGSRNPRIELSEMGPSRLSGEEVKISIRWLVQKGSKSTQRGKSKFEFGPPSGELN